MRPGPGPMPVEPELISGVVEGEDKKQRPIPSQKIVRQAINGRPTGDILLLRYTRRSSGRQWSAVVIKSSLVLSGCYCLLLSPLSSFLCSLSLSLSLLARDGER